MISSFSQPYKWKKERISSHFKEPTPIISKVLVWKVEYQIKVVSPALDLIFILFCIYLCQGKPFSIIVIQVYAPASNAEEAEVEGFYEDLQPSRTNTQKRCPLHYRGLECKSRKSRNTWSNRQIWPWNEEWSRAKANRVFPRKCTGHSKHPLPTTQEKTVHMDITRWSTPKSDWLYSLQPKMEKLYTVSKNKTRSWLVAQIINSLLPNSDLNWKKRKPLDYLGMT